MLVPIDHAAPPRGPRTRHDRQRGVALASVVLLLVVLVLITFVTARVASTQLRGAGNRQFQSAALDRAEAAVARAEVWLAANPTHAGFVERSSATPQLYPKGWLKANDKAPLSMTWDDTNSLAVDANTRYMIELVVADKMGPGESLDVEAGSLGPCKKLSVFRVYARGLAERGAERVLETVYAVPRCT